MATKTKQATRKGMLDLAARAQALRTRIHRNERALAVAYPDQVAGLESDLANERALLDGLTQQVEDAKEQARDELSGAVDTFLRAREALLKLNGWFRDPGFKHPMFTRCYLSMSEQSPYSVSGTPRQNLDPVEAYEVEQMLREVGLIELPPEPRDSLNSLTQRRHEEKVRNERAGRGYFTDDDLMRRAENPEAFWAGQGARPVRAE